ncbi:metal-dependent hydrolase [Bacillus phage Mater]|uniref:Anti-Pycsar protein Apyc1 n=1 Tax=Bacillus phage Mater TaxID=1540090 RepID=A0A0A0RUN7_9CAUD|nr:metal-dependent hydrolase [Bacillus phage Mater]AIW03283.1 metal-dependent hydrolase [Bacillus phage Mater]
MIKVTMIGVGSAFSKRFHNTSALVHFPNGYNLLLDCGHSVPQGLHEQGIELNNVNGVFISHLHADHIGGLEEVALYNKFVLSGRKIDLLVPSKLVDKLWAKCLAGGLGSEGDGLSSYFNVHILHEPGQSIKPYPSICFLPLKIFPTAHVKGMDSYAIGIGDHLFYTADTLFDLLLLEQADKYNFIFHDCQMSEAKPTNVHACIEELLTVPDELQERIFLMHYGDNIDAYYGNTGLMDILEEGDTWYIEGKSKIED